MAESGMREATMEKGKDRAVKEQILQKDREAEKLAHLLQTLAPEEGRRDRALREIRQAAQRKTIRRTLSPLELAWTELQYISPGFWLLQGALTVALVILLEETALNEGGLKD